MSRGKSSSRERGFWPWFWAYGKYVLIAEVAIAAVGLVVIAIGATNPPVVQAESRPIPTFAAQNAPTPVTLDVPANPRVLFVGDSFTQGFGADDQKTQNWAVLTANGMGWTNTVFDHKGYTGFDNPGVAGGQAFSDRIAARAAAGETYDLVIFQSGLNDVNKPADEVLTRTKETIELARSSFPDAEIAVLGPYGYRDFSPLDGVYRKAIAAEEGVLYISPEARDWMAADEKDALMYTDGWHPNTAGYQRLAEKVQELLRERLVTA
jgi:lysophospholipase L1-like esterase